MKNSNSDVLGKEFFVTSLFFNSRQGQNEWCETLNRVRIEEPTDADRELIESRRMSLHPDVDLQGAIHTCYTNREVYEINKAELDALEGKEYLIPFIPNYPPKYKYSTTEWGTIDDTPFMETLRLKERARVMLVYNINVLDGLVNGAIGKVIEIKEEVQKDGPPIVSCVLVKFEDPDIGKEQRKTYALALSEKDPLAVPIYWVTLRYQLPYKRGNLKHGIHGEATQIPLKPAKASTAHKLQGATLMGGQILVAHGHKRMKSHIQYVMLSRAPKIDQIFIDEEFSVDKLICKGHCEQLAQSKKLEERSIVEKIKNEECDLFMINIRSLPRHFDDLQKERLAMTSKVIVLVETWLGIEDLSTKRDQRIYGAYQIPGWKFYHSSYKNNTEYLESGTKGATTSDTWKGQGCIVYASDEIRSDMIGKYSFKEFQILSLNVQDKYQLIVLYIKSGNKDNEAIIDLIHMLWQPDLLPVVLGDFNYDPSERSKLSDYIKSKGLVQIVKEPTHKEGRTLDQCFVPKSLKDCMTLKMFSPYYSDHSGLLMNFL